MMKLAQDDVNSEDGPLGRQTDDVSAPAPSVVLNPESLYYGGKKSLDSWLVSLGRLNPDFRQSAEDEMQHSKELSTRFIAQMFRRISAFIWSHNSWFNLFQSATIPIQNEFNDKLCTHNENGTLNIINSDNLTSYFAGKQEDWPNLILTSNHARAWQSSDLSDLMKGVERIAGDAWGKPLDLCRLKKPKQDEASAPVKGKTIIALACHTEKDMYLNGAELIDRRLDLAEDTLGNAHPEQRSLKHISPAAVRLAKLMLKLTVEPDPQGGKLVDLGRAKREHIGRPFMADDHSKNLVLRPDAASIAQHIKLVGYSKGANSVTDAMRFLYMEYARLGDRLKVHGEHGELRPAKAEDIRAIISNLGLLSIAPGEVPLTEAERKVGMKRVTILNTHDLTAGHLVLSDDKAKKYDHWSDRLITIEGTTEESGHSIVDALGKDDKPGFIMNPTNENKPNYRAAQDEVRAFFASNHHHQAITSLCLFPDGANNVLYVQFAPGISRADEVLLKARMEMAFHRVFKGAKIESDLSHRRTFQVILDQDALTNPVISSNVPFGPTVGCDHKKIEECESVMQSIRTAANDPLFVTTDAVTYLSDLRKNTPDTHVTDLQRVQSGPAKITGNIRRQA